MVSSTEPLEISLLWDGGEYLKAHLFLDNFDITSQAKITHDYIFYLPAEPSAPGAHRITLLLTSGPDTVLSDSWTFNVSPKKIIPEKPVKMPLDVSVTAGAYCSQCDKDTSGHGLSYPIGWKPSGEVAVSGQLSGGFLNSYLSYDPVYDDNPHGLLQYDHFSFGLSLGEFYPELSSLAFSGASPLGGLVAWQGKKISATGIACRTQPADTLFQTYAQYLFGGQLKSFLTDSLWFSAGYLYGYDQPGSLPDSVRFRSATYIYNDTLTGFSDTLITIDSLISGKNRLNWLSMEWRPNGMRIRSDYALSGFMPDSSSGYIRDHSYLWGIRKYLGLHFLDLQYISWGQNYKSFGNPYLETAKNEFLWTAEIKRHAKLSVRLDGSVYKVFTDSANGNSLKTGGGMYYGRGNLTSAAVRLDYNRRPYLLYLYQNRNLSFSAVAKLGIFSCIASYSYSINSGSIQTRSHNSLLGLSRYFIDDRLFIQISGQYYSVHDNNGLTDQARTTIESRVSWQISPKVNFILNCRGIENKDTIDPSKNYHQGAATVSASYRF